MTHHFFSVYISGVCTPSLPLGKVECGSLLGCWGQPHRVRNLGSVSLSPPSSVILGRLSSDFSGLTWNSYNFRSWGNDTAQSDGAGWSRCLYLLASPSQCGLDPHHKEQRMNALAPWWAFLPLPPKSTQPYRGLDGFYCWLLSNCSQLVCGQFVLD